MCCAPCAIYPMDFLNNENIYIEGVFYNPNIHPYNEYLKRKENVQILQGLKNINVTYIDEFLQDTWESFDGTNTQRCEMCYSIRIEKTVLIAKKNNFDAFTTSLFSKPLSKSYANKKTLRRIWG